MKPKPTTVTHTWIQIYIRLSLFVTKANNRNAHLDFYKCAEHILPEHGHHVPEQTVYVWFTQQTKRVLRLQYGTRKAIPCINLDIQQHTNNVFRGPGWRLLGIAMPPPLPRPSKAPLPRLKSEIDLAVPWYSSTTYVPSTSTSTRVRTKVPVLVHACTSMAIRHVWPCIYFSSYSTSTIYRYEQHYRYTCTP